jgi:predicted nuclease with TOPRIM domain
MYESSATAELTEFREEMGTTLGVIRGVQLEHDSLIRETQRTVVRMEKIQQTHGRRLERLEDKVDRLEGKVDRLEGRFDRLEGRFDGLEGRFDGLDGKVDGLEGRFDGLDGKVDGLEGRFDGLDGKVDGIGETLQEVLRRLPAKN